MKKTLMFLILGIAFSLELFAVPLPPQPGFYFFYFNTSGDEKYSDDSLALDGECYALVWRSAAWKDKTDGLFYADGTSVDTNNCIVLSICNSLHREIWEDEESGETEDWAHSTNACIQVDRTYLMSPYMWDGSSYSKGVLSLFLFDTRVWDGSAWVVGGMTSERTVRALNGYGVVNGFESLSVETDIFMSGITEPNLGFFDPDGDPKSWGDPEDDTCANESVLLPPNVPLAQFSAVTVTNGLATVTVTNTASYLTYGLSMTNDLAKINSTTNFVTDKSGTPLFKQGVGEGPLTWEIDVSAYQQGFFKLFRKSVLDE